MNIFGSARLGYVVVDTEKFADWRRFGRDAIGMHLNDTSPDALRFRLDDHQCRFLVQRGTAEDVTALGWQVDEHRTFDEILTRVTRYGVPVANGSIEETELRGVERLVRFPGPNGLTQEIFTRPGLDDTPLNMAVRGYYDSVFDARLTDYIDETIGGLKFKIRAVNRLLINPIRTRVQHVNIQVADLDDMTASYQRVNDLGFQMALAVGQHTNDRELSYYAMTPSGFEWEVGWNPIVINEKTWEPTTYQGISLWGHTREGQTIVEKLAQFKTAAQSLLHREDTVPALACAAIPDD